MDRDEVRYGPWARYTRYDHTVDTAAKDLEDLISKDPHKSVEGMEAFNNLRPFKRSTVHSWMIKLGCKYEKATVSYYTDSHEAEETKRDFRNR